MCDKKTKIVASPSSTTPTLPKGRFGMALNFLISQHLMLTHQATSRLI